MAQKSSKTVIYAALIGNFMIAVSKFFASIYTGSSAMLSEGIHSLVDTGNQVLLLYGLKRAEKPADARFPFGYGKEVYFWSFVVAILIFAVGAGVSLYEGIHRLLHPSTITNYVVNYIVLVLALMFEGVAWFMAVREFRQRNRNKKFGAAIHDAKDPSLMVVLFEDSAAMLGLLTALIALMLSQATGWVYFDGIASIIIGVILGVTAGWLAYETKGLLIGESADPNTVASIRELAGDLTCINTISEILTMHIGPHFVLVTINADFKDEVPVGSIEQSIATLDQAIKEKHPEIKRVFIEAQSAAKAR
jgi:cation diffusion facilitator family transporter